MVSGGSGRPVHSTTLPGGGWSRIFAAEIEGLCSLPPSCATPWPRPAPRLQRSPFPQDATVVLAADGRRVIMTFPFAKGRPTCADYSRGAASLNMADYEPAAG